MASQGVSEEISTHHPSEVLDSATLNGLTIEANDGSFSLHAFALFEFGSGWFIV